MMENPTSFVTGNGYNSYESSRGFYAATHNLYLNYLYNLGMIGLTLFLAIFIRILAISRQTLADADATTRPMLVALIFGLFAFLVSQMFQEYHATGVLLMATLGISMRVALETIRASTEGSEIIKNDRGRPELQESSREKAVRPVA